ncbi:MAG: DotU family type IV/VI secretion system protein [Phycisphaerae bacterium]
MNLLDLTEPFFQYMCRLTRSARKDAHQDPSRVRGEIKNLLTEMKSRASSEPRLIEQYEKVELPLLFYADFMIKESSLPFAGQWKEMAYERNELAGDEKFFELLDQTLAEQSSSANERLAVFYTCMGLGFTGWYTGQPEYLRKKMLEISSRISGLMDADEQARICPEAYNALNTSDLVQPPGGKLLGIVLALVGLLIVVFVANIYLFKWSTEDLGRALDKIIAHDTPRAQVAPADPGTK